MHGSDEKRREVVVDPLDLDRLAAESAAWATPSNARPDQANEDAAGTTWSDPETAGRDPERALALLGEIIATRLTPRQQEIVDLYFYQGKSQTQIAAMLGIQQQVVSRQLFGAVRKGRRVGGAIRKLRKVLAEKGIELD